MPLQFVRNDITRMEVDAIVNAANETLLGGGGVDGAIHRAAGPELLEECRKLHGCRTGEAKLTKGYRLSAAYVIHTVGPVWNGGDHHEKELLSSCYTSSLELAWQHKVKSIAFPMISTGVYGYPKAEALQVAVSAISAFLLEHEMTVYLVLFDRKALQISEKLFQDIQEFIDDHYVELHADSPSRRRQREMMTGERADDQISKEASVHPAHHLMHKEMLAYPAAKQTEAPDMNEDAAAAVWFQADTLEEALGQIDESFSEMLLRKIDEAGMKDSECYKKANIDRKLFSKIRKDEQYRPSKQTAIAFAIALELSFDETQDMLRKAGYTLSHSNKFDIIIEYFIRKGEYNIFEINEALFNFDQSLLGG